MDPEFVCSYKVHTGAQMGIHKGSRLGTRGPYYGGSRGFDCRGNSVIIIMVGQKGAAAHILSTILL